MYLGRILLSTNYYFPSVEQNLHWARGKLRKMVNILGREGMDRRTAGRFYVVVVQSVILFGLKKWMVTPWLEKALAVFQHQAVWQM